MMMLPQILRGDGSDSHYRGKVFLGTDGSPITFTVRWSASWFSRSSMSFVERILHLVSGPTCVLGSCMSCSSCCFVSGDGLPGFFCRVSTPRCAAQQSPRALIPTWGVPVAQGTDSIDSKGM